MRDVGEKGDRRTEAPFGGSLIRPSSAFLTILIGSYRGDPEAFRAGRRCSLLYKQRSKEKENRWMGLEGSREGDTAWGGRGSEGGRRNGIKGELWVKVLLLILEWGLNEVSLFMKRMMRLGVIRIIIMLLLIIGMIVMVMISVLRIMMMAFQDHFVIPTHNRRYINIYNKNTIFFSWWFAIIIILLIAKSFLILSHSRTIFTIRETPKYDCFKP